MLNGKSLGELTHDLTGLFPCIEFENDQKPDTVTYLGFWSEYPDPSNNSFRVFKNQTEFEETAKQEYNDMRQD